MEKNKKTDERQIIEDKRWALKKIEARLERATGSLEDIVHELSQYSPEKAYDFKVYKKGYPEDISTLPSAYVRKGREKPTGPVHVLKDASFGYQKAGTPLKLGVIKQASISGDGFVHEIQFHDSLIEQTFFDHLEGRELSPREIERIKKLNKDVFSFLQNIPDARAELQAFAKSRGWKAFEKSPYWQEYMDEKNSRTMGVAEYADLAYYRDDIIVDTLMDLADMLEKDRAKGIEMASRYIENFTEKTDAQIQEMVAFIRNKRNRIRGGGLWMWGKLNDFSSEEMYLAGWVDKTITNKGRIYYESPKKEHADVFIPFKDDFGDILFMRRRSMHPNPKAKYLSAKLRREIVQPHPFQEGMYNAQELSNAKGKTVIVTEGEFKALISNASLNPRDYLTVGITGITQVSPEHMDALLAAQPARIVICFDRDPKGAGLQRGDYATDSQREAYSIGLQLEKLVKERNLETRIEIARLPNVFGGKKVGIDDLVMEHPNNRVDLDIPDFRFGAQAYEKVLQRVETDGIRVDGTYTVPEYARKLSLETVPQKRSYWDDETLELRYFLWIEIERRKRLIEKSLEKYRIAQNRGAKKIDDTHLEKAHVLVAQLESLASEFRSEFYLDIKKHEAAMGESRIKTTNLHNAYVENSLGHPVDMTRLAGKDIPLLTYTSGASRKKLHVDMSHEKLVPSDAHVLFSVFQPADYAIESESFAQEIKTIQEYLQRGESVLGEQELLEFDLDLFEEILGGVLDKIKPHLPEYITSDVLDRIEENAPLAYKVAYTDFAATAFRETVKNPGGVKHGQLSKMMSKFFSRIDKEGLALLSDIVYVPSESQKLREVLSHAFRRYVDRVLRVAFQGVVAGRATELFTDDDYEYKTYTLLDRHRDIERKTEFLAVTKKGTDSMRALLHAIPQDDRLARLEMQSMAMIKHEFQIEYARQNRYSNVLRRLFEKSPHDINFFKKNLKLSYALGDELGLTHDSIDKNRLTILFPEDVDAVLHLKKNVDQFVSAGLGEYTSQNRFIRKFSGPICLIPTLEHTKKDVRIRGLSVLPLSIRDREDHYEGLPASVLTLAGDDTQTYPRFFRPYREKTSFTEVYQLERDIERYEDDLKKAANDILIRKQSLVGLRNSLKGYAYLKSKAPVDALNKSIQAMEAHRERLEQRGDYEAEYEVSAEIDGALESLVQKRLAHIRKEIRDIQQEVAAHNKVIKEYNRTRDSYQKKKQELKGRTTQEAVLIMSNPLDAIRKAEDTVAEIVSTNYFFDMTQEMVSQFVNQNAFVFHVESDEHLSMTYHKITSFLSQLKKIKKTKGKRNFQIDVTVSVDGKEHNFYELKPSETFHEKRRKDVSLDPYTPVRDMPPSVEEDSDDEKERYITQLFRIQESYRRAGFAKIKTFPIGLSSPDEMTFEFHEDTCVVYLPELYYDAYRELDYDQMKKNVIADAFTANPFFPSIMRTKKITIRQEQ